MGLTTLHVRNIRRDNRRHIDEIDQKVSDGWTDKLLVSVAFLSLKKDEARDHIIRNLSFELLLIKRAIYEKGAD